ncbi:hypothetical protein BGZ63DRAFT_376826 [Mariannaea sp. PMI_226]|nr:hypothetical protein BGZ63DRAFT_376826 [Mariannaea sp. PMI_226]
MSDALNKQTLSPIRIERTGEAFTKPTQANTPHIAFELQEDQSPDKEVTPPQSETATESGHSRAPSQFTSEEIDERKRTWTRIPMPLDPRKARTASAEPKDKMDAKGNPSQQPQNEVANSEARSRNSSPEHPVILTPESTSSHTSPERRQRETSPVRGPVGHAKALRDRVLNPQFSKPEHDDNNGRSQVGVVSSTDGACDSMAWPSHPRGYKNFGGKRSKSSHNAMGGGCRQEDRSAQAPRVNTPIPPNSPISSSSRPEGDTVNQVTESSQKKKKKKNNNSKKGKQGNESRAASMAVPTNSTLSVPSPVQNPSPRHLAQHVQGRHYSASASIEAMPSYSTPQSQRLSSTSPARRPRQDAFNHFRHLATKHAGHAGQDHPDNNSSRHEQSTNMDGQNYLQKSQDTREGGRGRAGYREGCGGSLRMGKNRKPRLLMTQPSVAEEQLDTRVAPPSSDNPFQPFILSSPNNINITKDANGVEPTTVVEGSRLNPRAKDFTSPGRFEDVTPVDKPSTDNGSPAALSKDAEIASPTKSKNASVRKSKRTNMDKIKIDTKDQTTSTAAASTTPPPPVDKVVPPSPITVARKLSKSHKRARASNKGVTTPERTQEPQTPQTEKKDILANEDWPSLPPPRERATTVTSPPSLWGKKSPGSKGSLSPINK